MNGNDADESRDGDDGSDLPLNTVLGLLANPRRRILLHYFVNQFSDSATLDDLTAFVFSWEAESDGGASRSAVRSSLERTHLPTLADSGVLDYDADGETVTYLGSDRLERVHSNLRRSLGP